MSTSIRQSSGTTFTAWPPAIRPRLTDGPSKSSERSDAKGSSPMRWYRSTAFNTAFWPSQGVEPWAGRPRTSNRTTSAPFA